LGTPTYAVTGTAGPGAPYGRAPRNSVRLELGREHPGGGPQDNRYTRGKRYLDAWLRDGVLRRDGRPAIYPYAAEYRLRSGAVRTMRGFLSLVKLEEFGTGRIFPHENTRAAAKDDRYQLLETCRGNFSPVFSLYADPAGDIIRTLEGVDGGPPRIAVTDSDGGHDRLWTVTDPASIERVVTAMKPLPLFIADGHHRYESALRYRNAQRKAHGESSTLPSDWVLMYFSNLDDPGLPMLGTRRVLPPPLPCPPAEVRQRPPQTFPLAAYPCTQQ